MEYIPCSCGHVAYKVYFHAPVVHGAESFNPYWDIQIGEHFESKEQKTKRLKELKLVQTSGSDSPRESSDAYVIGSKSKVPEVFKTVPPSKKE